MDPNSVPSQIPDTQSEMPVNASPELPSVTQAQLSASPQPPEGQPVQQQYQPNSPGPAHGVNGLSIAGLVLAFVLPLLGLILSIIGLVKAKKHNQSQGIAVAGIVISSIMTVLFVIILPILVLTTFFRCTAESS